MSNTAKNQIMDKFENLEWNEGLSVSHPEMDAQHKKLVYSINAIIDCANNPDTDIQEMAVRYLPTFQTLFFEHLSREEAILARVNYPDLDQHKAAHDGYRDTIPALIQRSIDNNILQPELLQVLYSWNSTHIQSDDQRYKGYMSVKS